MTSFTLPDRWQVLKTHEHCAFFFTMIGVIVGGVTLDGNSPFCPAFLRHCYDGQPWLLSLIVLPH